MPTSNSSLTVVAPRISHSDQAVKKREEMAQVPATDRAMT
jgi:hypothetical protein